MPNSQRFPTFFSLDGRLYKEFTVHTPFRDRTKSKGRRVRLGVYSLNLTNHQNNVDVYSNVASPLFGNFSGNQRRFTGMVIDLVE